MLRGRTHSRQLKRLVILQLVLALAFSLALPVTTFASPKSAGSEAPTVNITLRVQRQNATVDTTPETVAADLSESYGFPDEFNGTAVTLLDVLIAESVRVDENGFALDAVGFVSRFEGRQTNAPVDYSQGLHAFVNGVLPNDGNYNKDGFAEPVPPGSVKIANGDLVTLYIFVQQDDPPILYTWFEVQDDDGKWVRPDNDAFTVTEGDEFSLRVAGFPILPYCLGSQEAQKTAKVVGVPADISVNDVWGKEGAPDSFNWLTDDNGIVEKMRIISKTGPVELFACSKTAKAPCLQAWLNMTVEKVDPADDSLSLNRVRDLINKVAAWDLYNNDFNSAGLDRMRTAIGLVRARPYVYDHLRIDSQGWSEYTENILDQITPVLNADGGMLDRLSTEQNMEVMHYLRASGAWMQYIEDTHIVEPFADFDWAVGQGPQDAAYALLALDSSKAIADDDYNRATSINGYDIPGLPAGSTAKQTTRTALVEHILDMQRKDGSWDGLASDAETTAIVLTALAPYTDLDSQDTEVSETTRFYARLAVKDGLDALSLMQDEKGDFGSTQVDARVIVALTSLGVSPDSSEFTKVGNSAFGALVSSYRDLPTDPKQSPNGAFAINALDATPDQDSTDWALYALTATYRFLDVGVLNTFFFDFSDIEPKFYHPIAHPEEPDEGNGTTDPGDRGASAGANASGAGGSNDKTSAAQGSAQDNWPQTDYIASGQTPLASVLSADAESGILPGFFGRPGAQTPISDTSPNSADGTSPGIGQGGDYSIFILIGGFAAIAVAIVLGSLISSRFLPRNANHD